MADEPNGAVTDPEKPYDAGDPVAVKEKTRTIKRRQGILDEVTKQLMSTKSGRSWVREQLAFAGVNRTPFALDPLQTAFNCGQQNVGQRLLAEVTRVAPKEYLELLKEQSDD